MDHDPDRPDICLGTDEFHTPAELAAGLRLPHLRRVPGRPWRRGPAARPAEPDAGGLEPPDLVLAGHNHIYARSHPLDPSGQPVRAGGGGVRHFVTGGGGGPLYAVKEEDPRFPRAMNVYHFVYLRLTASAAFYWAIDAGGRVQDSGCFEKGSNVDHPLSPTFGYADALPPQCAVAGG